MSTTAQPQETLPLPDQESADPPVEPEAPVSDAETKASSNSREYTLFEEARVDTWTKIGAVTSDSPDSALDTLGEQKLKSGQRFMAIPSRYVRPVKPKVTTVTTVSYD